MADPGLLPLVMIAEDDPDDRLMLTDAFMDRCQECQLCFVEDGLQLIEQLEPEPAGLPDLIILDLNMPLMDGREVLEALKGNARLRQIPVVVMTTSRNPEDVNFCYDAGARSYIVKPASYSELLDIVSVLKRYWLNTVILPTRQGHYD
jgi:two-component system response regulator